MTDGVSEASATVTIYVEDNYLEFDTQGSAEADQLFGDMFGFNSIYGGAGDDVIQGGNYEDSLAGGAGNDLIRGMAGVDNIDGGSGDDLLYAGRGDDIIRGGTGNDLIFGGQGQDTFIFGRGDGQDTIADFNAGRYRRDFYIAGDYVSIDVHGVDSFADLMGYASQDGSNVVFDFGNGDLLILERTQLAALDEDAFTFV